MRSRPLRPRWLSDHAFLKNASSSSVRTGFLRDELRSGLRRGIAKTDAAEADKSAMDAWPWRLIGVPRSAGARQNCRSACLRKGSIEVVAFSPRDDAEGRCCVRSKRHVTRDLRAEPIPSQLSSLPALVAVSRRGAVEVLADAQMNRRQRETCCPGWWPGGIPVALSKPVCGPHNKVMVIDPTARPAVATGS